MKMENNAFQVDSDYDEWMDEFTFKVKEREEKNQGTFSLSTAMKLKLIYKQYRQIISCLDRYIELFLVFFKSL